ncbi:DUF3164 family protein [Gluconobacter frateurii]|uniref:DUF3164 family protein n=1 Tax=Gluconobacter frateurii NRIC 0228 TaxID=1307946 RepID=A0ABQ0Q8X6_9PROT|nr:DUF3164 family protein [Gluconobacter frateurii]GBR09432.1 hypothetical protein AA0228_0673 [Gluconobacter frateurii NRIC 0228]GLP91964.1 hypothetical protein GCM10007868_30390 [Gluconobacter frateurii]
MINKEKSLAEGRILRSWCGVERRADRLKPRELLASDLAEEMIALAVAEQERIRAWKEQRYADIDALLDLILQDYGLRLGGSRGGNTFENHDHTRKVTITVADQKSVNQAIVAAQALLNQILDDMMGTVSADLRKVVNSAFSRHPTSGRISTERILALKRQDFDHPLWPDARKALSDAVEVIGSRTYLRFYMRETSKEGWKNVDLNFSSL